MEAFELAVELGSDGLEMDVHVTADGVPVIIHDPTTGRTTDRNLRVAGSPAGELAGLDAGHHFGGPDHRWRGRGLTIPSLAAVLERFPGVAILLELKSRAGQAQVRSVLDRYAAHRHVAVASSEHRALDSFRDGVYRRAASRREIGRWFLGSMTGLGSGARGYDFLSIPRRKALLHLTAPRALAAARRQGLPIHVWTIDDAAVALRLWAGGTTGIITNTPGSMVGHRPAW